jgi:P4 family phage/plasmid primase-like protien
MGMKTVSSPERNDLVAGALALADDRTPPVIKDLARFMELFVGGEQAHGLWDHEKPGKEALTVRAPATRDNYEAHLDGRMGLGLVPLRLDGTCRFAAVDIDIDIIDHLSLLEKVIARKFPLSVCRSKSGGAHLYLFLKKPGLPAAQIIQLLKKWAVLLGYPSAEVFPKQAKITQRKCGNWINLPYFGHGRTTRYAVGPSGRLSLGEFLDAVEFYDPARCNADETPLPEPAEPAAPEVPIVADGKIIEGRRNETLTSIAGSMRRRGLGQKAIEAALLEHNQEECEPPLPEREVSAIAASVSRYPSADETAEFSDNDLALQFSERHVDELRYVDDWGCWMRWLEELWGKDRVLHAFDLAREVCRGAAAHANSRQTKRRINSATTVAAIERLARCDKRHAATAEQWDADPWLLNTPDDTVSLRLAERGRIELRPHRPEDYLTKITAASPKGSCRRWLQFLNEITTPPGGQPDKELQRFLQRMAGYCLTGSIQEEKLFFLYGTGANGKSVFVNTLAGVLGDYAKTSSAETFMESYTDRHPTELAYLRGARLVTVTELEAGRRWSEAKIKALTGGDKIPARFMRQDFFEFVPEFKLLFSGNNKPSLRSVNEAIRRRLVLIPFLATIPAANRDPELIEKLKDEWGGILRWAVEGCAEWQRHGLNAPAVVCEATEDYLTSEDTLSLWIEQECVMDEKVSAAVAELYESWRRFCEATGEQSGSGKRFSQNLEARNFRRGRRGGGQRIYWGIGLKCPAYREQM